MSTRYVNAVTNAADFLLNSPVLDKDNAPIAYQRDLDQLVLADPESSSASAPTLVRIPGATTSVQTVRRRCTIAEVNAGVALLAAAAGWKYRMVRAAAIAIGGAVGAVDTVDILGTQTTSKKLVAFAQAALLQSAVLVSGATGADVLADGASFAECDANTAITVNKTGATATTATHVDIEFSYVLVQA